MMAIAETTQKKRSKREIARSAAPSVFTVGNAAAGFLALMAVTRGQLIPATAFLLCAMFMDMLDGLLARKLKTSSAFGLQLDSLADTVSFVVAPAAMIHFTYFNNHIGALVAIIAVICGISRLARFNIQDTGEFYVGVSTPLFTFMVVVLCLSQLNLPQPVLAGIFSVLALAMVSTFRYPALRQANLSKYKLRIFVMLGLMGTALLFLDMTMVQYALLEQALIWGFFFIPFALFEPLVSRWRLALFELSFLLAGFALSSDLKILLIYPVFFIVAGMPFLAPCFEAARTPQTQT